MPKKYMDGVQQVEDINEATTKNVHVDNFPSTQDVQVTNIPETQNVQLTGSNAVKLTDGANNTSLVRWNDYNDSTGGTSYGIQTAAGTFGYNGATWDRIRNNTQGTLLASAARTGSTTSPIQTNYNAKGVVLLLNITSASGTGGIQVRLNYIDPVTNNPLTVNVNPTAITANGLYAFIFYPGASGGIPNQIAGLPLPRTWSAYIGHMDASSYTYSVGYALIL